MAKINRIHTILMASCACVGLSACGADDIASPGEGTIDFLRRKVEEHIRLLITVTDCVIII